MSDPVRLYNPNPDAPNVWGAPPTERNRLAEVLAGIPSPFDVFAPPPAARKAYGSLAQTLVDATSPAAVRDTVQASGQTMDALRQGRGWDAAGGVANMLTAAAGILPGGRLITKGTKELAQPIRAYHGSPHDFDRFDMSKIGTGEGAQAYGHGLYFAENEKVAKGYRDALGGKQYRGSSDPAHMAFDDIQYFNGSKDAAIAAWKEDIRRNADSPAGKFAAQKLAAYESGAVDALNPGRMYEVNIHADPAKFLDWDKPLAAQSPVVQNALREVASAAPPPTKGPSVRNRAAIIGGDGSVPGDVLYNNIGGFSRPAETSAILRDAGIPGIKYLDAGSRTAGDGSRNYVAFDDKMIEILRKYGLLPVAAGAAAGGAALSTPQPDDGGF